MKIELYSLFDRKVGFDDPWPARSDGDAMRIFVSALRADPQQHPNKVNQFPQDFELYHVGSLDQESGLLTPDLRILERKSEENE